MPTPRSVTATNRLAGEKSPYLLQHQHNPVDWYPWGEEAFSRARAESKPIFLSIGYSTCHWCHVMERESFENTSIADYLNRHFISIKVDREERPDVDKIYMTFVQATTGQGGWPLNVFLTPDLRPFFGGTYFPPDARHGRPGFPQLLEQIHEVWSTRQSDVLESATDLHQRLVSHAAAEAASDLLLGSPLLDQAAARCQEDYDPRHGGFGGAPKFPRPTQPAFLLRHAVRHNLERARRMILHTCDRMAAGGIHDQLGGGFHRYAVDAEWLVPHFEKMLYDNAQLTTLYLDAYLVSGDRRHADTARAILAYVNRDMTHPEGGFFSAEDADSEGHEGKFYCWTRAELERLLTPEELDVVVRHYGITDRGNFVDHSHPAPLPGQNVLSIVDPDLTPDQSARLDSARAKMIGARKQRVRPHLDDKILASWNGLMLGAYARAYAVLGDDSYRIVAEKNLDFLKDRLWDPKSRTLYHRWRDGERDAVQLLDAYAFLFSGVLDLYEATLEPRHLEFAIALAESMRERFFDREQGAFYQSTVRPDLILRLKEGYDGAEPSGNSVATLALLRLAAITDRKDLRDTAEKTLRYFGESLHKAPSTVPNLLRALDFWLEEPRRIVIAGDVDSPPARALLSAVHRVYQPNKVVLGQSGPVEEFARTLPSEDHPVAYLCTGTACQPPTADPEQLQRMVTGSKIEQRSTIDER